MFGPFPHFVSTTGVGTTGNWHICRAEEGNRKSWVGGAIGGCSRCKVHWGLDTTEWTVTSFLLFLCALEKEANSPPMLFLPGRSRMRGLAGCCLWGSHKSAELRLKRLVAVAAEHSPMTGQQSPAAFTPSAFFRTESIQYATALDLQQP